MAIYHGGTGRVYVSTTGSGNAVNVAALTDWSLDMASDTVEVTALTDTNKTYVQGLGNLQGTLAGFWDAGVDTLFKARTSSDGCKMYIYPAGTSGTTSGYYAYGPAYLSLSMTGAVADAVKVSGNFVAKGSWGFIGLAG